ncbi:MAG: alanine/glycine:cation symporter family protein [Eubacteriales bacterium]
MTFSDRISAILAFFDRAVWGTPTLLLLIFTGVLLTLRTGGYQFRAFFPMLRHTVGSLHVHTSAHPPANTGRSPSAQPADTVSPFQSLCTALSATIGTGNIVGVAYAIVMGGPGAVFWMWVASFLGMILKYAESVLGVYYRVSKDGRLRGGAMYYIERGFAERLHRPKLGRALALLFSAATVAASFGMGNMSQVAAIKESVFAAIHAPHDAGGLWIGAGVALAAALVLLGGAGRIARANERLVPFMALFYTAGCMVILAVHADRLLPALCAIFGGAFRWNAAAGGVGGFTLAKAAGWGFKRGIFSNEAGLGSSAAVHAASCETVPARQGLWGLFEVFVDTGVICTLTALVLLTTGVADSSAGISENAGLSLAVSAFADVFGAFGAGFIALSVTLFAFSSILGWSFYGVRAWEYLFGTKTCALYLFLFAAAAIPGALLRAESILRVSDIFNGFMALPNLAGLLCLTGVVATLTPGRAGAGKRRTGKRQFSDSYSPRSLSKASNAKLPPNTNANESGSAGSDSESVTHMNTLCVRQT